MNKKSIRDIDVNGKKVFIRVDFNVPMDENQNITNDKRISCYITYFKLSFRKTTQQLFLLAMLVVQKDREFLNYLLNLSLLDFLNS